MFFLGLQDSENFSNTVTSFISSPGLSKLKVSYISLHFCPTQVNKTEALTLSFFLSCQWQLGKTQNVLAIVANFGRRFLQMKMTAEVLTYP